MYQQVISNFQHVVFYNIENFDSTCERVLFENNGESDGKLADGKTSSRALD